MIDDYNEAIFGERGLGEPLDGSTVAWPHYLTQRLNQSRLTQSLAKKLLTIDDPRRIRETAADTEPSTAMLIGTTAHNLVLRDLPLADEISILPKDYKGRNTKDGKEAYNRLLERNKPILRYKEAESAVAIAGSIKDHKIAGAWLRKAQSDLAQEKMNWCEVSIFWQEKSAETGKIVKCAARPDLIAPVALTDDEGNKNEVLIVADIKTQGRHFKATDWLRGEFQYEKSCQPIAYCRAVKAAMVAERPEYAEMPIIFAYIIAASTAPYEVWVAVPSIPDLKKSYQNWAEAVNKFPHFASGKKMNDDIIFA